MPWKEIKVMNQRSEFVLRAMQTANFRDLCREYGISPKTGYKWKERFIEEGLAGMADQSRRPFSTPGGLAEAVVASLGTDPILTTKVPKVRRLHRPQHKLTSLVHHFNLLPWHAPLLTKNTVHVLPMS